MVSVVKGLCRWDLFHLKVVVLVSPTPLASCRPSPEPTAAALAPVGAERCDLIHGQWTVAFSWSLPNPCRPPGGWLLSTVTCQVREDTVQVLARH